MLSALCGPQSNVIQGGGESLGSICAFDSITTSKEVMSPFGMDNRLHRKITHGKFGEYLR